MHPTLPHNVQNIVKFVTKKFHVNTHKAMTQQTATTTNTAQRTLVTLLLTFVLSHTVSATIPTGTEYYIWLNIYEKLLGSNADDTGPALSAFGTNTDADSYVFTAEPSDVSGYVLLRQKSSGKYLAASDANSYNVVLNNPRTFSDHYLWALDEGCYTYLKNKKSGKYLGIDGANKSSDHVSVYYDKPRGSHSQFTAIPTQGGTWAENRPFRCHRHSHHRQRKPHPDGHYREPGQRTHLAYLRQHPALSRCKQLLEIHQNQRKDSPQRYQLPHSHLPERCSRHPHPLYSHGVWRHKRRLHPHSRQTHRPGQTKQRHDHIHAAPRPHGYARFRERRPRIQPCLCGRPCRPDRPHACSGCTAAR